MSNELKMTVEELETFIDTEFPQVHHGGRSFAIEGIRPMGATVRLFYHDRHLRPGGTISGPAMMSIADYAMYIAILAQLGPVALAVTTNFSINFLRKPEQKDLMADCTLLKLGKRLAVAEVSMRSEGSDDVVAHVVGTYSIPPRG
ncbi:PaaI family thioesterase [Tepidamorphus sp. 3E244]|uniref:PaaI family thioesterase n=1 Tax=Tepidamorphus sp. 3E244 TaxID=3385498 RepID=UPI0038FD2442